MSDSFGETKKVSSAWYLVPIFFGIIGGIIAWLIIKDDDQKKAKNCLMIGLFMIVIEVILYLTIFATLFASFWWLF